MAASSRGLTPFGIDVRARRGGLDNRSSGCARLFPWKIDARWSAAAAVLKCGCSDSIRRADRCSEECRLVYRPRIQPSSSLAFTSYQSSFVSKQDKFFSRCNPRTTGPQSRDSPPKRDTGIANEKDWGISLLHEDNNESGTNEDGSTWYQESGEDIGENGYRCRWTIMGGQSSDASSEWRETWWEKSDWTGYKELGVEKSGSNAEGDSWWETWREVLHQDEWSNIASIERSAQKQAKSGSKDAGWYENWWEKYDAKGQTEKGAHKYGRLDEQSWWEKWGEKYDGRGSVLKWGDMVQEIDLLPLMCEVTGSSHESSHLHSNARTDKWAETELGTKWGDKWEEKFFSGIGSRQGETWHVSNSGHRWSRTWGEEHFGNGKVHKYGKSTTGESWDIVVDEETSYEAEPHYGWADVVGDSSQLLSIQPTERPSGVFPNIDFGSPSSSFPNPPAVPPPPPGDVDEQPPPSPSIE